ncbi:MAG: hypothetical protein A3K59_02045 [Euryarchaeota archaeon RBG_19FT_COMBO_69_17]|nr:MAG: hypothetical protein A3K59_02045 [Euryarchaeota archaeon RBG_19FT_COMBO_69_17]
MFQILADYGKQDSIMETGFSSWSDPVNHGQDDQETWVNCNIPFVRDLVRIHNLNSPQNSFLIATWYELLDHGTDQGGGELNHYGLVQAWFSTCVNLAPKLAYDDFRAKVSLYYW